ncbi:metallophosphoesterase [Acetobacterium sp.]|uniref:metallophosphoesterase n=1 Tax=Acetobacterium sp. TaxID=1872094 RepID=UPI002F3F179C
MKNNNDSEPKVGVMTFASNVFMSCSEKHPSLNNSIKTITLTFSEKLDAKTVSDAVTLYTIKRDGALVEETISFQTDPDDKNTLMINNEMVRPFTGGEAYKIHISSNLKSVNGASLASDYVGYFATNNVFNFTDIPDLNNERSQIVIISDLHLGIDDAFAETVANKQALASLLTQVNTSPHISELVITGDLFDGWFLPMEYVLPDSQADFFDGVAANNQTIVDAFNNIIQAGDIKVTYVPGNHDILLTEADVARILPGINQARDDNQGLGTYVTGKNSEIAIEHGHRWNIFCTPDPISNREITKNNTSILPPGYFFTRIAANSLREGQPQNTTNTFPVVTAPDKNDVSQFGYYVLSRMWQGVMELLPVHESSADKLIKTNIDGFTEAYAINDLFPYENREGVIDVKLYKNMQDTWDERQDINSIKVKIPYIDALVRAATFDFTDDQAQNQFFDLDASKRIVVFGHTHVGRVLPRTNPAGEKTIYANSGTWIDRNPGYPTMTFVVITQAKTDSAIDTVNLYQYSNEKTITQWCEGQAIKQ